VANELPMSELEQLPSTVSLPQREPRKKVEHTPVGSFADNADLLDPIRRQTYYPEVGVHGLKQHIDCEASGASGGHSGPATHFIQLPGEKEDQREAVCAVHQAKIVSSALEKGQYDVQSHRIHPEDVQKHLALRGIQAREKRTYLEGALYNQGMRGEDALFDRKEEELGKGGGRRSTAIEELNSRRTPEQSADTLERALERARTEGGRSSIAAPKINVDGVDMTLGESNAAMAILNRKAEPEKYHMRGVKSPDGSVESIPTPTRTYKFNKVQSRVRGGRKKNNPPYPYDTSNENLPGYTEEEMKANPDLRKSQEERLASGIPLEGIKPRGFSKDNNRAIKVTLTGMATEAPEVGVIERFAKGLESRQTKKAVSAIADNEEATRLRKIEAKKTKNAENRNAAFKLDWSEVPRPE